MKRHKNPRIGCRGGDYLLPTSFRHLDSATILNIQARYAEGFYTQAMLAEVFRLPPSIIGKACRTAEHNVVAVRAKLREQGREATLKLRRRRA